MGRGMAVRAELPISGLGYLFIALLDLYFGYFGYFRYPRPRTEYTDINLVS